MPSNDNLAVSAIYCDGDALPAPESVQTVGTQLRFVTAQPPPIDERTRVELAVADGRRVRLKVMAIDTLGPAEARKFAVLAQVIAG